MEDPVANAFVRASQAATHRGGFLLRDTRYFHAMTESKAPDTTEAIAPLFRKPEGEPTIVLYRVAQRRDQNSNSLFWASGLRADLDLRSTSCFARSA